MDLNRVTIIGGLTRDPEWREFVSGKHRASFGLATSRLFFAEGKEKKDTQYHRITAWGRLAERVQKYLHKGSRVYVEGYLRTGVWQTKTGDKRSQSEVIVEQLIMLDPRKKAVETAAAEPEVVPVEAIE
ncbi:MAG: single-stranded DNA-binding protein [Candidatus Magasanikbacteria bacterium]|nr:single-stranded DNA-binding protein [Candidatus Magasanikbacteria bacterium]